jgi:hypothetical protein
MKYETRRVGDNEHVILVSQSRTDLKTLRVLESLIPPHEPTDQSHTDEKHRIRRILPVCKNSKNEWVLRLISIPPKPTKRARVPSLKKNA